MNSQPSAQREVHQTSLMTYQQPMAHPTFPPAIVTENKIDPNPIIINDSSSIEPNSMTTGFQRLDLEDGIYIEQKLKPNEVIVGGENKYMYHVHPLNRKEDAPPLPLFKCKERTDFCQRRCLPDSCKPFKMEISMLYETEGSIKYESYLHLERPCKCACFGWNRNQVRVMHTEGGRNEYLGKIVDPFNWCNIQLDVYSQEDTLKYIIFGNCCQAGIWFKCPCQSCETLDLEIRSTSGEIISKIQKGPHIKNNENTADNFLVDFPKNISPNDKLLLMSGVLFLDYKYFETNLKLRKRM